MSRIIYDIIYKEYNKYNSNKNTYSFILSVTQTYKLLLDIIDDKNDNEFNDFYIKYMSKFQLKRYYFARLFNPYKECNFNSFDSLNDFINKTCSTGMVNEEYYYLELNAFLIELLNICQKLKKENEEIKLNIPEKQQEEINIKEPINKNKKKKPISATMKRLVWNTHIGEEIGKYKCLCCNITAITQLSFNCGHIIAEANGGATIVSNLKPICQNCNSSMGTKNMHDFMQTLK